MNYINHKGKEFEEERGAFRSVQLSPFESNQMYNRNSLNFRSIDGTAKEKESSETEILQTPQTRWVVKTSNRVPMWGLEVGTVLINETSIVVSARIDNCLRLSSIQTVFDNDHAKALCKTIKSMTFTIYLYDGPNKNSTYVEILRQNGCGVECRRHRLNIINAAKGISDGKEYESKTKKLTIPKCLLDKYVPPSTSHLENILDRSIDQFHSKDINELIFALQHLATITNTDKAYSETAYKLSSLIMLNRYDVRDCILQIYFANAKRSINHELSEQVCNACLSIFANGITALSKGGNFDNECKDFIEDFMPCLIDGIENVRCTHHAYLALKCLKLLFQNSSTAITTAKESGNIVGVVEKALEYGLREHFRLEDEARSTIGILEKVAAY